MAVAQRPSSGGGYLERPRPSGLADVIDIILDKGLVIDAYVRVAEAVGRLNLAESDNSQGLPELLEGMTEGGSKSKTRGAVEGVKEKLGIGDGDEEERERAKAKPRARRRRRDEDEE